MVNRRQAVTHLAHDFATSSAVQSPHSPPCPSTYLQKSNKKILLIHVRSSVTVEMISVDTSDEDSGLLMVNDATVIDLLCTLPQLLLRTWQSEQQRTPCSTARRLHQEQQQAQFRAALRRVHL